MGPGLKMWSIKARLPYRTGAWYRGVGELASSWISTSKTGEMVAVDEPKEPRTKLALRGVSDKSSWMGRSFWVLEIGQRMSLRGVGVSNFHTI